MGDLPFELNKKYGFYGVDNCRFKLGGKVYEAIEDESDGYRSYLSSVELSADQSGGDIFFKKAIDTVTIEESDNLECVDGYRLVSTQDDKHVWLEIGTNYNDDYYPWFVFNYTPRK